MAGLASGTPIFGARSHRTRDLPPEYRTSSLTVPLVSRAYPDKVVKQCPDKASTLYHLSAAS